MFYLSSLKRDKNSKRQVRYLEIIAWTFWRAREKGPFYVAELVAAVQFGVKNDQIPYTSHPYDCYVCFCACVNFTVY